MSDPKFSDLVGKILTRVVAEKDTKRGDTVRFFTQDNRVFEMGHSQDCCERVYLEDVSGDLKDITGSPVLVADERVSSSRDEYGKRLPPNPDDPPAPEGADESQTWTFYRIQTNWGTVVLRWFGSSNGYYSESVDFCEVTPHE
jgi:hypothetical protein